MPSRNGRARCDEPQRGVENFRSALRQQILPVGTGRVEATRADARRSRPAPRAGRRPAPARIPRTSGVERGHDRAAETRAGAPRSSRRGACGTWRTSPPRPSSPMTTVSASTARVDRARPRSRARPRDRRRARRPARRPRRSRRRRDRASGTPARCCSTATSIDSRLPSNACATRRGIGACVGATSACTSTHSGRDPFHASAVTTEPVAPARRSARNSALGSSTAVEPVLGHLHEAELVGGAEAVLQRAQHAQRVMTVALERQHRVDDVLERARAGERAVFRDVTDEQRRDVVLLGEPHERLRAVAHLRDRPGRARRVGIVHRLDRVDREHRRLERRRRARRPRAATFPRRRTARARACRAGRPASAPAPATPPPLTSRQRAPRAASRAERLEQQRALAHPGLAAEERDRARDEAAAEHPVELGDPGRQRRRARRPRPAAIGTGSRGARRPDGPRDRRAAAELRSRHRAPVSALRAPAEPLGRLVAAVGAHEQRRSNTTFGSCRDRSRGLRHAVVVKPRETRQPRRYGGIIECRSTGVLGLVSARDSLGGPAPVAAGADAREPGRARPPRTRQDGADTRTGSRASPSRYRDRRRRGGVSSSAASATT